MRYVTIIIEENKTQKNGKIGKRGGAVMKIRDILVQNVTAFHRMQLTFTDGIHVFLGENGSGKTHLLKMMYACCAMHGRGPQYPGRAEEVMELVFAVQGQRLIRDEQGEQPYVELSYVDGSHLCYRLGRKPEFTGEKGRIPCVLIPVQEMLSHSEGFIALYEKYNLPFDQTYYDILLQAQLPPTRQETQLFRRIDGILHDIIGGIVVYENDTFYMQKINGKKIQFILEAEGLRKFGLLWKLLRAGAIDTGTILFWDEPEANINPELMPALANILMELQRGGVQIFLATHHYNLIRYLDVIRNKTDSVKFYNFYQEQGEIACETSERYQGLQRNPIDRADKALYETVIQKALEEMQDE